MNRNLEFISPLKLFRNLSNKLVNINFFIREINYVLETRTISNSLKPPEKKPKVSKNLEYVGSKPQIVK